PISAVEEFLTKNANQFNPEATVLDVCSVKVYPTDLMKKHLPRSCQIIGTHPMFGPDSIKEGAGDLRLVLSRVRQKPTTYNFWRNYFQQRQLKVVEITPRQHDKLASESQSIAFYIGRVLGELNLKPTPIDTLGFKRLQKMIDQTCNDSWQLFYDLQTKNPYGEGVRQRIERSFKKINRELQKEQHAVPVLGIQGGQGSFNEEVARTYDKEFGVGEYKIKYLYDSARVIRQLKSGKIDYGLMAIYNSVGGPVLESMHALAQCECRMVQIVHHPIRHFLLAQKGVNLTSVKKIISHPQAIKQCRETLKKKFPRIKTASGQGELIDQATAAKVLAAGKLPPSTAVLANRVCADLFDLKILAKDLQDQKNNVTSFALIKRA
ncbi:MAG: prephenate dehydrogenase/arogenate dehydrogenase family protein, partial [Parcubacteria group bacterium]|nr:prephenate dehydrogenase/arogenate dehydrogenase family protein [Parcubacteria group bacterium]